jgi:hypothetical protein
MHRLLKLKLYEILKCLYSTAYEFQRRIMLDWFVVQAGRRALFDLLRHSKQAIKGIIAWLTSKSEFLIPRVMKLLEARPLQGS